MRPWGKMRPEPAPQASASTPDKGERAAAKKTAKAKPTQKAVMLSPAAIEQAGHERALVAMRAWATGALAILKRNEPDTAKAVDEAVCRRGAELVVMTSVTGGADALQLCLVDQAGELHRVMTVSTRAAPRKAH